MKYIFLFLMMLSVDLHAGSANGKVIDVAVRSADDVMVIRMDSYSSKADCVNWAHPLGLKIKSEASKAIYSMLLAAKISGQTIHVAGTGVCEGGIDGKGYEVIKQTNIGSHYTP